MSSFGGVPSHLIELRFVLKTINSPLTLWSSCSVVTKARTGNAFLIEASGVAVFEIRDIVSMTKSCGFTLFEIREGVSLFETSGTVVWTGRKVGSLGDWVRFETLAIRLVDTISDGIRGGVRSEVGFLCSCYG